MDMKTANDEGMEGKKKTHVADMIVQGMFVLLLLRIISEYEQLTFRSRSV